MEQLRNQLGGFGFAQDKQQTLVGQLSGGERARLMLALATLDKPNLLILDEPTNHLDIDARNELLTALNDFDGAVILVSHDRRLIEATADRPHGGGVLERRPGEQRLSVGDSHGRKGSHDGSPSYIAIYPPCKRDVG
jgi:ABC-type multidrug transport system ATPase subunit